MDYLFPYHDQDKLTTLLDGYSLMKKKKYLDGFRSGDLSDGLTVEEQGLLNKATAMHISDNPHQAEYWAKEKDKIKNFDRFNPPQGLHCENMPNWAIDEMVADWCAISEEFGNTPFAWLEKTVPSRWVFTREQVNYMKAILRRMWNEN